MVTIPLEQYNQLRDNATMNHMLIDKMVAYESRMNDFNQRFFALENRMFDLEHKLKS